MCGGSAVNITLKPIYIVEYSVDVLRESYGAYEIRVSESCSIDHYKSKIIDEKLCIIYGNVYEKGDDIIYKIHSLIHSNEKSIYDVDGSFLYLEISKNGEVVVFSEREGLIPIYYRAIDGHIVITTRCDILFNYYTKDKIDYSALYDYLRYGVLIGDHTFSIQIKLLQGGSRLHLLNKAIDVEKLYFFHHDSENEESDSSILYEQLNNAYVNAIIKRIDRPIDEISVFLSGGMDSRMVVGALNSCAEDLKATCISFGLPKSEEVDIARKVADVNCNPFLNIELSPADHLVNAEMYASMTCGTDMSAQSYIINVSKKIKKSGITAFMTGSFIECHIGGTFLPDSAIETSECLSEFLPQNMSLVKCELFKEDELFEIILPNSFQKYFAGNTDNLIEEAKKYDSLPVKDIIQSFIIDNRDKRLVLNREIVPSQYLDYINPNFDINFLKVAAKIPAKERRKRKFYREFMVEKYRKYADIVYNNTTLPVSAPLDYWKKGSSIELEREKLFSEIQKSCLVDCHHIYYPHYYSDFDGYSHYDQTWINFLKTTLLSESGFLIGRIIDKNAVKKMLEGHQNGRMNYRKQLINLASLELFFKLFLKE